MKVSLQFRCRRLLRLMMALEGGIDVLQAEFVTGIYDQLVAIVHKLTSSHPCFARLFTSTLELIILRRAAGSFIFPLTKIALVQISSNMRIKKCAPRPNHSSNQSSNRWDC